MSLEEEMGRYELLWKLLKRSGRYLTEEAFLNKLNEESSTEFQTVRRSMYKEVNKKGLKTEFAGGEAVGGRYVSAYYLLKGDKTVAIVRLTRDYNKDDSDWTLRLRSGDSKTGTIDEIKWSGKEFKGLDSTLDKVEDNFETTQKLG